MNLNLILSISNLLRLFQEPNEILAGQLWSVIRWPREPTSGPPICLMEVTVDLFIAFQVTAPVSKKNLKKKHGHCSHLAWDQIKYTNHLRPKNNLRFCRLLFKLSATPCGCTRFNIFCLWSTFVHTRRSPAAHFRKLAIPICYPHGQHGHCIPIPFVPDETWSS